VNFLKVKLIYIQEVPRFVEETKLLKIKQFDNNCIRCSRALKVFNETKLKSPLLHNIKPNFRKAVKH
jgi:hypothetical protein